MVILQGKVTYLVSKLRKLPFKNNLVKALCIPSQLNEQLLFLFSLLGVSHGLFGLKENFKYYSCKVAFVKISSPKYFTIVDWVIGTIPTNVKKQTLGT